MLLVCAVSLTCGAEDKTDVSKYLAGAVPTVNGYVQFDQEYTVEGKTQKEIFQSLFNYIQANLVEGPEQLPQSRITEADSLTGTIAASIDEYLYFKRTNWQIHRVHFYYQIVFQVKEGGYFVMLRNLRYKYDPEVSPGEFDEEYKAEKWITDDAALTKNGTKLARVSGKFRKGTIDRKDEIFAASARAAGVKKKYKLVEVEE